MTSSCSVRIYHCGLVWLTNNLPYVQKAFVIRVIYGRFAIIRLKKSLVTMKIISIPETIHYACIFIIINEISIPFLVKLKTNQRRNVNWWIAHITYLTMTMTVNTCLLPYLQISRMKYRYTQKIYNSHSTWEYTSFVNIHGKWDMKP